jgi:hypothetical protein
MKEDLLHCGVSLEGHQATLLFEIKVLGEEYEANKAHYNLPLDMESPTTNMFHSATDPALPSNQEFNRNSFSESMNLRCSTASSSPGARQSRNNLAPPKTAQGRLEGGESRLRTVSTSSERLAGSLRPVKQLPKRDDVEFILRGVEGELLKDVLKRIARVSSMYDRGRPGGGLGAFEGAKMTPSVFREQLRRNFQMKVTSDEMDSLMGYFDRDGDGHIDCGEFLNIFFRLGKLSSTRLANANLFSTIPPPTYVN